MTLEREPSATGNEGTPSTSGKGYIIGQSITDRFKYDAVPLLNAMELEQQDASNNCFVRSIFAGLAGGVMGLGFGVLMGAMDPAAMNSPAPLGDAKQKTVMQVMRETFKLTRDRSVMYAKSFATIGILYSGIECVVEKHRGKHDMYNSLYTGFLTGGLLARGSGAMGMAFGATSFAAFSVAMDRFMGFH